MTRICFILVFCVLVGCSKEKQYQNIQLRCGACRRIIYDGPGKVDLNGARWPIGSINHCSAWDINCVSELMPENSVKRAAYFGYVAGRKDALEFRYEKEMDPKTHHAAYIEDYKKGYKEVIDVRALPNKED